VQHREKILKKKLYGAHLSVDIHSGKHPALIPLLYQENLFFVQQYLLNKRHIFCIGNQRPFHLPAATGQLIQDRYSGDTF
jgi:hypothetical protein